MHKKYINSQNVDELLDVVFGQLVYQGLDMGRGRKHNILQEAVTKSCCETMVLQRRRFCLLGGDFKIANNILVITAQMAEWYRAYASGALDLDLLPNRVKPVTLKLVFTVSLLDAKY